MIAVSVIQPMTNDEAMIDAANMAAPVTAEVNAQGRALMKRATMRKPPERTSRAFGGDSGVVTGSRLEGDGDRNHREGEGLGGQGTRGGKLRVLRSAVAFDDHEI